jgi:mono/diheme cytochrome c family protein
MRDYRTFFNLLKPFSFFIVFVKTSKFTNMKKLNLFLLLICAGLIFNACKKEEAAPVPKTTFVEVNSILKANCAPCHVANSGANFDARKKTVDDYNVSKQMATFIQDRIQRDPTAAGFMPRGKAKLSDADIKIVTAWIADGLLEK